MRSDLNEWWEFQVDDTRAGFSTVGWQCETIEKALLERRCWLERLDKRCRRPRTRIKHCKVVETIAKEWAQ